LALNKVELVCNLAQQKKEQSFVSPSSFFFYLFFQVRLLKKKIHKGMETLEYFKV
jgi:hypothetical protein